MTEGRRHDEDSRFAALMQLAARPLAAELLLPPLGLETRLCAFIEGAAARREQRRRPWALWAGALFAGGALAAAAIAFFFLGQVERAAPLGGTKVHPSTVAAREIVQPLLAAELGEEGPIYRKPAEIDDSDERDPLSTSALFGKGADDAARPRTPLLVALRSGQDWRSRQSAAVALARVGLERELSDAEEQACGEALTGDPDWRVREAALQALEPRNTPAATRVLAAATEDPHVTLRFAAVRILTQRLGMESTADALLRRLDRDPDWRIRDVALQSLLRSPEGARAATMALADRHRKLREHARAALATLR